MAPKVLITGGTGYIGGSVLHTIATAHPEYDITALLRKTPEAFNSTYPNVKVLHGDYDSTDILTEAAEKSDIVIHNGNSDHVPSLTALIRGLLNRKKSTDSPGYLIHLSGTGIVSDWATESSLGIATSTTYTDTSASSLSTIRSLPDTALHRPTEKILHDLATSQSRDAPDIKITIMCPPDIYGRGFGLTKKHSALIPFFIDGIWGMGGKDARRAFYYKTGENTRGWVHIADLMRLYTHVVEAAVAELSPSTTTTNPTAVQKKIDEVGLWNADGYVFAATQNHTQIGVAKAVGGILHRHGYIADPEPKEVDLQTLDPLVTHPMYPGLSRYLFASNSVAVPDRAKKIWGHEAKEPGLMECLEADVLDAVKAKE